MNALLHILIAVLVVCDVSMSAEQASFGDLAREAEKRKETAERPAKTYTNDDLRPVKRTPSAGRSAAGCQSEHEYDPTSGDTQLIARCSDGTTRVQGSNTRTGLEWKTGGIGLFHCEVHSFLNATSGSTRAARRAGP
jgi:hypothetical protein